MTPTSTPAFAVLDIDGDGDTEASFDGRLVVRYLFGFRGAALTEGAVDADCTRCLDGEIEANLEGIEPQLDIDDDGEEKPLTDGILARRWLFGFRDDILVTGAVDPDHCQSVPGRRHRGVPGGPGPVTVVDPDQRVVGFAQQLELNRRRER